MLYPWPGPSPTIPVLLWISIVLINKRVTSSYWILGPHSAPLRCSCDSIPLNLHTEEEKVASNVPVSSVVLVEGKVGCVCVRFGKRQAPLEVIVKMRYFLSSCFFLLLLFQERALYLLKCCSLSSSPASLITSDDSWDRGVLRILQPVV